MPNQEQEQEQQGNYFEADNLASGNPATNAATYANGLSNDLYQNAIKPVGQAINSGRTAINNGLNDFVNGEQVAIGDIDTLRRQMKANPGVSYGQQALNFGNAGIDAIDATRDFFSPQQSGMRLQGRQRADTRGDFKRILNGGGVDTSGIGDAVGSLYDDAVRGASAYMSEAAPYVKGASDLYDRGLESFSKNMPGFLNSLGLYQQQPNQQPNQLHR